MNIIINFNFFSLIQWFIRPTRLFYLLYNFFIKLLFFWYTLNYQNTLFLNISSRKKLLNFLNVIFNDFFKNRILNIFNNFIFIIENITLNITKIFLMLFQNMQLFIQNIDIFLFILRNFFYFFLLQILKNFLKFYKHFINILNLSQF